MTEKGFWSGKAILDFGKSGLNLHITIHFFVLEAMLSFILYVIPLVCFMMKLENSFHFS